MLVVAGYARSATVKSSVTRPTFASEQTAKARMSIARSADHSFSVWDSNAIEGTRNSTDPPLPATSSAIRRLVNVFPVPHAITSFPRSWSTNPRRTASRASCWCGRSCFCFGGATSSGLSNEYVDQSMSDASNSSIGIWFDGSVCPTIASCAFFPSGAVATTIRDVNGCFPEAVKNESRSPFWMVEVGA